MADFNFKLGKSKNAEEISTQQLGYGGIKKEEVDEQYKSIFDALDTGSTKGVLEASEMNTLKSKIQEFAKNNVFSKREVGKFLKSIGLNGVNAETFFGFLKSVVKINATHHYSWTKTNDETGETIINHGRTDEGLVLEHIDKNGKTIKRVIHDNNDSNKITEEYTGGAKKFYTAFSKEVGGNVWEGGEDAEGNKYTVEYDNDDEYCVHFEGQKYKTIYNKKTGGYTLQWLEGEKHNELKSKVYDANDKWLSGTDIDGEEYTIIYTQDGYTQQWKDSKRCFYYDNNDNLIGGVTSKGIKFTDTIKEDKSTERVFKDGRKRIYSADDHWIGGVDIEGRAYTRHSDGDTTYFRTTDVEKNVFYTDHNDITFITTDSNGDFYTHAKNGETLDDTLNRLGLTQDNGFTQEEINNFIQINKNRGTLKTVNKNGNKVSYFLLSDSNTSGNIVIPKNIAEKLNVKNMMVNASEELKSWQNS